MIAAEIEINDFKISTKNGKKSPNDFIIQAKFRGNKRLFTPKHAHFVIDFYGKLCYNKEIAKKLFNAIKKVYSGESPEKVLTDMNPDDIKQINNAPGYPIEYILYTLWLIFEQEDINYPRSEGYKGRQQPYQMFQDVLNGIHPVNAMKKTGLRI
ncbi:hypothetical protein K1720_00680 [Thermococcus argininiproducens]|uniref:Uncharacterized protein n=1 Tax=Thermococcus argininiproducens TaxID=2866384 RepID=A0A9E7SCI5_9EURY|nr:hypothetical protein [Thermococcus argininiproducens]USH00039.1 hypothetical protein K1720_00680 [Thermococcus argininiproducens]